MKSSSFPDGNTVNASLDGWSSKCCSPPNNGWKQRARR
jgi:hypothetical protein